MTNLQFRILYRGFLFRMVDLELLSVDAQGDTNKLLGQFAALLALFSIGLGLAGLMFDSKDMTPEQFQIVTWSTEHFLIATTMLVVGLFAVLSWDSTFPDRRDLLILAPLPVRTRTLFLAKAAAVATGLSLAVFVLNAGPGLSWPLALSSGSLSFIEMVLPFARRSFAAYWITMFAAGTFLFCCVLGVQGLGALLPRKMFLRLSAFLQVAAFCLFVSVYFLQPQLATPSALSAPENQQLLACLPSYWFLGLFQQLNGTLTPPTGRLAHRAWIGLAIAASTTAVAYVLSYFRTLRKIIEEPDIVPSSGGLNWSPKFGTSMQTAIVLFSIRALSRSRQHRVILSFYLGIGFAIVIALSKTAVAQRQLLALVNAPLLISSVVMLCFWIVGTRVIFAMPLDLRANWIFRMTPIRGGPECLSAARRSLYLLAWAPVWAASAVWFLWIWPWQPAVGHLVFLGLLGAILVELSLYRFQKIPFTCSWLPGKSNAHMEFWGFIVVLQALLVRGGELERRALQGPVRYAEMLAGLTVVAAAARWRTAAAINTEESVVQFEEAQPAAIMGLGLLRDGVLPSQTGE